MPLPTTNVWDPLDPVPAVLRVLAAGRATIECQTCGSIVELQSPLVSEAVGRLIDDDILDVEPLFRGGIIARAAIADAAEVWLGAYARERAH